MSGFNLDDYVDVAERIRLFYEKYPDGRIQTVEHGKYEIGGREFVYCKATAYRGPDDERGCNGIAWEPFPGPTPYTKDSELMNSETSAWGRAIIAAGIPSKKIASADEVRNRQGSQATGARADSNGESAAKKKSKLLGHLDDLLSALQIADPSKDWRERFAQTSERNFGKSGFGDLTIAQLEPLVADAEKSLAHANVETPVS